MLLYYIILYYIILYYIILYYIILYNVSVRLHVSTIIYLVILRQFIKYVQHYLFVKFCCHVLCNAKH